MKLRYLCLVVVSMLALSGNVSAQEPTLSVEFNFAAAGKVLDAGNYAVGTAPNGNVVLTPEKGGNAVELPLLKEISRRKVERVELVFGRVGSMWFLSEVWLPGKGGSLVGKLDYSEENKTVKGAKAAK